MLDVGLAGHEQHRNLPLAGDDAAGSQGSPDAAFRGASRRGCCRPRNALARRIDTIVGGDAGAIAAAMVTGKRDLLSNEAKETIREAGIFHIITISGIQMTLVAAIFFVGVRRLLALSQTLALSYPIKKWAALFAIAGAIFYDIATGSRVGTERALFMTLIMLTSVLLDRQALTMRNLAIAAALFLPHGYHYMIIMFPLYSHYISSIFSSYLHYIIILSPHNDLYVVT
jgi:predicted membrane metal-binding protein